MAIPEDNRRSVLGYGRGVQQLSTVSQGISVSRCVISACLLIQLVPRGQVSFCLQLHCIGELGRIFVEVTSG